MCPVENRLSSTNCSPECTKLRQKSHGKIPFSRGSMNSTAGVYSLQPIVVGGRHKMMTGMLCWLQTFRRSRLLVNKREETRDRWIANHCIEG